MAQRQSILGEFFGFLSQNKKWWLLPIILALAAMAGLILLSGSPVRSYTRCSNNRG